MVGGETCQPMDVGQQLLTLFLAAVWAIPGWNLLIGFPEAFYWNFLDPYLLAIDWTAIAVFLVALASQLLIDVPAVRRRLSTYTWALPIVPQVLFAASAIPNVEVRSTCFSFGVVSLGWCTAALCGSTQQATMREFGGVASLLAATFMLMLRWFCDTLNPVLLYPSVKVVLACCGAGAALRVGRTNSLAETVPIPLGLFDWKGALAGLATGLMASSLTTLYQMYLSTFTISANSAFLSPTNIFGMAAALFVGLGLVSFLAVSTSAPELLERPMSSALVALIPLVACAMQSASSVSIENMENIRGTGFVAYIGLLLLSAVFPFMLATLGKAVNIAARAGTIGFGFLLFGLLWLLWFVVYTAVLLGGSSPAFGEQLKAKQWLMTLGLGLCWSLGVALVPKSLSLSQASLQYSSLSEPVHASPARLPSLVAVSALFFVFFFCVVPVKIFLFTSNATASTPPLPDDDVLSVVSYNVQQGYDLHGFPNFDCVVQVLDKVGADIVGISESNGAHYISANNEVSRAYAAKLGMHYFPGAPGTTPSVDQELISKLPLKNISTIALPIMDCSTCPAAGMLKLNLKGFVQKGVSSGDKCGNCPPQTHLWITSVVEWQGQEIQVHTLHTEWLTDNTIQLEFIAEQMRTRFRNGPLVLAGDFNLPKKDTVRPFDTALRLMMEDTGLKVAGNVLDPNVSLPVPPTEHISDLHLDYIFYRGLELVDLMAVSDSTCSDHMPVIGRFRLPAEAREA